MSPQPDSPRLIPSTANGFFKINRSETTLELISDPPALALATLIAFRAKWTRGPSILGLEPGQALIGDHRSCGLTARGYRTAKQHLVNYQIATFKPTSKGTIAALIDTSVFDVNIGQGDKQTARQATSRRQTGDKQATTNEEGEEGKEGEEEEESAPPAPSAFSEFVSRIQNIRPEFQQLQSAAVENTFTAWPREAWGSATADFCRDMTNALQCPPMPLKVLNGYLRKAAATIQPQKKRSVFDE